jgi:hypothetical protein
VSVVPHARGYALTLVRWVYGYVTDVLECTDKHVPYDAVVRVVSQNKSLPVNSRVVSVHYPVEV